MTSDFTFVASAPLSSDEIAELQLWNAVRSVRDLVQVRLFLDTYPKSRFAKDAEKLLATLTEEEHSEVAASNPTPTRSSSDRPLDGLLGNIRNWMFQLQELDEDGAVEALAATEYDMLVIEAGYNFSDWAYDTPQIIDQLKVKPDGSSRSHTGMMTGSRSG